MSGREIGVCPGYMAHAVAMLCFCNPTFVAHALEVPRVALNLKDEPTIFVRVAGPNSEWRKANLDSLFKPASASDTVFRSAEVPPERMVVTRKLLTELNARRTAQEDIEVELPADVLFDFDKSTLRPEAASSLEKAADLLRSYPDAPVVIDGHTDDKGTDAYNDALSLRRANVVAAALDAGTRSFTTHGLGKRRPVISNQTIDGRDNPAGRQRNRRVEIRILKP